MAMTQEESAALMRNTDFHGRIQVCCVKYADSIKAANSNAIGHVGLERWADSVFLQPPLIATQLQPPVVMDPGVQTAGVDATGKALVDDVALQGAVEATVNKGI